MRIEDIQPYDVCYYCLRLASHEAPIPAIVRIIIGTRSIPACTAHYMDLYDQERIAAEKKLGTGRGASASEPLARKISQHTVAADLTAIIKALLPTDSETIPVSSVSDFIEFVITVDANGTFLYRDGRKVGALEPCSLGKRGAAFHAAKLRHPRWKSMTGVLRVSSRTWIDYREDGTFQPYHLA